MSADYYQKRLLESQASLNEENEAMHDLCAKSAQAEGDEFEQLMESVVAQQRRVDSALREVKNWQGAYDAARC